MEPELIGNWRARIVAEEDRLLSPEVRGGAEFLVNARNEGETWGAYPRMPIDLLCSAAALAALEACEDPQFEVVIRTTRIRLRDHIRANVSSLDLEQSTAALRILAQEDGSAEIAELAKAIVARVRESQNGLGWGSPVPAIPPTAEVLLALVPYRDIAKDLIDPTAKLLFDQRKSDGGWPVSFGGKLSAPVPSAMAICALAEADPEQQSSAFQDAAKYFERLLTSGWPVLLSGSESVQAAAQVLRAIASLRAFSFELVQQGVHFILDQRNADGAWGETKGGNSNVEATSACLDALSAAGVNRLVSSRFAMSALTAAGVALQEANQALEQMRNNVRTQVTRETRAIIEENDRLKARAGQLEKEKAILLERVEQSERAAQDIKIRVSDQIDIAAGEENLRGRLGVVRYILRSFNTPLAFALAAAAALITVVSSLPQLRESIIKLSGNKAILIGIGALFAGLTGGMIWELYRLLRSRITKLRVDPFEMETELGNIGASERKLVLRGLTTTMRSLPPSGRESFLHQLNRLRAVDGASREATARTIAREFATNDGGYQDLRVFLSLFANLNESEQRDVVYSLREVQGHVAAS